MMDRKLDKAGAHCKVGVWYLVISVYRWDREPGEEPVEVIVRRARNLQDARPGRGRVAQVMRAQGYTCEFADPGGHAGWPYRVKAFMAKRPVPGSPLGRVGTLWSYAAGRA